MSIIAELCAGNGEKSNPGQVVKRLPIPVQVLERGAEFLRCKHSVIKADFFASVLVDAGILKAGIPIPLESVNRIVCQGAVEGTQANE